MVSIICVDVSCPVVQMCDVMLTMTNITFMSGLEGISTYSSSGLSSFE